MSYYEPKIYNKQNLKEKDLRELEYYEGMFHNAIENTLSDYDDEYPEGVDTLVKGVTKDFAKRLKAYLGYSLNEDMVSIIDNYEDNVDVKEVENPTTFIYDEDSEE